jgi:hypothetical protein
MDVSRRVRPPGGVRFAGWMIGIGAVFLCLAGVLLLFIKPDAATVEAGITQGVFQVVGFIMLAIGLLEFLLIYALWDGSNIARIITTVLVGLSLLGSLAQMLGHSSVAGLAFIQLLISIVILVGLWGTPSASQFFGRADAPEGIPPSGALPPPPLPPI